MKYSHHVSGPSCAGCNERLVSGDPVIQHFFLAVKSEHNDIHCSWVHRDKSDQEAAFASGESKLHYPNSKHNLMPSEAVDIFQIDDNGRAVFDGKFCAGINKRAEELGFKLRWGGSFHDLGDSGHFEKA